jgi:hypothetical protein
MKSFRSVFLLLFAALLFAAITPVLAQDAQVGGRISDPSGAVIPGASIVITNMETGAQRTAASNGEGYYAVPALQPGRYHLTVAKQGFKPINRDNIVVQVGDRLTVDFPMQIGAPTDSVTITSDLPLLRTEDAQQGLVIDNRRVQELPQYDRNALSFAALAPNVGGQSSQGGYGQDFRINGGRTNETEYFLDGQPVTTGYLHNVPPSVPSKEAVAEFKVMTNGLSAEYGRLSGGAVTLVTRSGTNDFHGSGYEFFKNDKLNANDWNSNRLGQPKGVFHDNVFGFTFGGPVWIPKVYRGRNKTFFFLNYEGDRHKEGSNSSQASVPTELERGGDFSQSLIDNGQPVQIYDPTTGRVVNGQVVRDPFPGMKIPANRFDALAKVYNGYYPTPNQAPLPNTSNQNNFVFSRSTPSSNDRWTGRLDQNWSSTQMTHFSVSQYSFDQMTPRAFSALEAVGLNTVDSYTASIEHDWMMSPSTMITLRGGVVRDKSFTGSAVDVNDSTWGLPANVINLLGGVNNGRVPSISNMSGLSGLGGGSMDDIRDTAYNASIAVQKMWGKHTFKAGYEHRRYYTNETTGGNFEMSSDRSVTSMSPATQANTGSVYAGYLLGATTWGDGNQMAGPASLQTYHGAYAQDDIKLTTKLTLNVGMRWDFEPPRLERFNRQVFWDRNYTWNIQPTSGWSWDRVEQTIGMTLPQPQWMTSGIHGRAAEMGTPEYPMQTLQDTHNHNFGPRVGVAYEVLPRTVIRASYGLIYMTKTGSWFLSGARWNVGYGDSARLAQGGTGDGGLTYPLTFSNPMPNGAGYIPFTRDINALNQSVMGNWWLSETAKNNAGREHNVQMAIQRELGSGRNAWVVEMAYNSSMGRGLPTWLGVGEHILPDAYHKIGYLGSNLLTPVPNPFYGQIPAGTARSGAMIPLGELYELNPLWSQISTNGDPDGTSNYNSGYVQIEHRFSGGFGFMANYTLSKLMQDCGGVDYTSPADTLTQAGLGRADVYSLSPSDSRHRVVLNYSVELPFGKGKHFLHDTQSLGGKLLDKVVGGWVAAGYTTIRSGQYLGVSGSNTLWWIAGQSNNSGASERPSFVFPRVPYDNNVSGHAALIGSANSSPYMNRGSFRLAEATPTLLEIGDTGPVIPNLVGPAFSQWDFSLMKNFGLGSNEARYFQLRFEAQNVFNHMNAGNPDGAIISPTFGMITSQNGSPRQAMVAAKLYF